MFSSPLPEAGVYLAKIELIPKLKIIVACDGLCYYCDKQLMTKPNWEEILQKTDFLKDKSEDEKKQWLNELTAVDTTFDHVVPKSEKKKVTGSGVVTSRAHLEPNWQENLVLACSSCNGKKADTDYETYFREKLNMSPKCLKFNEGKRCKKWVKADTGVLCNEHI